ncbi:MAG: MATE family efflux transporter [Bacteroidales bacterium]|nr:MATE family efflux transporter [Bacteroidales bacterium]
MNKKILNLAIPNIITNITIPLLGMVDLSVLGHLDSEIYIGAIAIGGMIFNFLYWGFSFLRMSTSGFTAQSYGSKNFSESAIVLSRALMVALVGSIFLIALQKPIGKLSFYIINGSKEVEALAAQYYYIRIYAAPATLSLYALIGWFLGMQNTKTPMVIAIVINVVNIVLDLIFVFVFNMKSDGVALGTVIAQYSGLFIALIFFYKYYKRFIKYWNYRAMIKLSELKKFFIVNKDIFIRTLCLIIVFSFFTTESANTNNSILAVNTLLLQFLFVFSYFIDGFAYAAEALTGRYVGAKNKSQLKIAVSHIFKWGFALSIPFTIIYLIFGENILYLLTDNKNIIELSKSYIYWITFIPVISFAAFLWDGIYVGATASKAMRNTMLVSTLVFFFPAYFLFQPIMGNHSLWLAMLLFMGGRSISQTLLARKRNFL